MNANHEKTDDTRVQMLNKVPEITVFFWIIKVLCTTVGETASDFLNVNLNLGLVGTSIVMGILLLVVLFFQIRSKKYVPVTYWTAVVLISVFGTLVTDNFTDSMGIPLEVSTIIFSVLLAWIFALWYAKEKTLSIHSIFTKRRELFYWLAILFTFALGTATGDLMAESLGLGYFDTGVIVVAVIALFSLAWKIGLNSILSFWIIYIMTRPLGASLGDYLSQSPKYGGLGLGATATSMVFVGAIIATVLFLSITKKDMIEKNATMKEETELHGSGAIRQTIAVLCLIIITSFSGYYWRHSALQGQTQDTSQTAPVVKENSTSDSVAPTSTSNTATSHQTPQKSSPLGDLSGFRTITQDTLDLVNSGDLSGAKTRVWDLEFEWDNAEARLKPMNQTKWKEVDAAVDKVLRQLRAVHQDAPGCKSALEALLWVLNG